MAHLPRLIIDLGLILGIAGITTLIFKKLNQPLVLGYILAGLLVSPKFSFFPSISDLVSIKIWADIGVIFLLFSLGLEFSFKKLVKVGGSASITAIIEISFMLMIGFTTGKLLGWSTIDSLFLGGILSISSTTIIFRAFDELGVKSQKFAGLVFGVLVVEDLVAVLLMVLLSTVSVSQQFSGMEMLESVAKLIFFLILWFLGGIFLLPSFLKRTKKLMTDETMLVVSIALCLIMVILATKAGFSPALGAFIMGSILAETIQAKNIENIIKPVKDLFGAVFFVSVGMLIDPSMILEYGIPVIILSCVVIFGKAISASIGALTSGQPLKQSVQTGLSLTQIGEFSFIIATLGLSLKVTSEFLYPIAVAVSAITTFTTPYLIRSSEPIFKIIDSKLPARWKLVLNRYTTSAQTITTMSDWRIVLRSYATTIVLHSVIIVAIILLSSSFLSPVIKANVNENWGNILSAFITLSIMSPFLWALAGRRLHKRSYSNLWLNKKYNRGPLISMELLRVSLAIFFIGFLLEEFFSTPVALIIALPTTLFFLFIFSRRLQRFYIRIENRFLNNLHEKEKDNSKTNQQFVPWDTHLTTLEVTPESPLVGKTLVELAVREKYGVNIALIERGKRTIAMPERNVRLYPGDKISVIGTDEQLKKFRPLAEAMSNGADFLEEKPDISLKKILITSNSFLLGVSIRASGIREKTHGLVVGIERDSRRILNPDSKEVFQLNDIVWVVGNNQAIESLLRVGVVTESV
ncbi:MAG TPA: cation:proton antiporter [Cytophagales bacterium]|nr:cation:proton antiporter [Cytophagales bacterium]